MDPQKAVTWLDLIAQHSAAIATILTTIVIPVLLLIIQRLAVWFHIKSESVKAMTEAVEKVGSPALKDQIAFEAGKVSEVVQSSIADAAAHVDPTKPNPPTRPLLRLAIGILVKTDLLGKLANMAKGK